MKVLIPFLLLISLGFQLSADDYYESNILGMRLKRIEGIYDSESGYALAVAKSEDEERRSLYNNGELLSVTRIQTEGVTKTETTEKDGETERIIRENGVVTSEIHIDAEGSESRTEYSYRDGRLFTADFYQGEEKIYSDLYAYTAEGRLLDVRRSYESGAEGVLIAFIFREGSLSRYWYAGSERRNYIRFDKKGIVFSDLSAPGDYRETREYSYSDKGGRIEKISDLKSGITTELFYDEKNRIIMSITTDPDGARIEESSWKYSGDLLSELRIRKELSLEVFRYEYYSDENLKKEVYLKNGIIIQSSEYLDEGNYSETLYRGGKPAMRLDYEDGKRVRTTELQD